MLQYLISLPVWLSAGILVLLPTVASMAGLLLWRRVETRAPDASMNEIAGYQFGALGTIHAVVLGFVVVVTWQNFSDAENRVAQEAGAAASIYRLSGALEAAHGQSLRNAMTGYLRATIDKDWPAMSVGVGSLEASDALDRIYAVLLREADVDAQRAGVLSEIYRQLDVITQARRDRILQADGSVPTVVWTILFGGAVVTLGFTYLFAAPAIHRQAVLVGLLALQMFSALFAIVAINHPFTGPSALSADPLIWVVRDFAP